MPNAGFDIESRERIKGLEVSVEEVKEDIREVKTDQRRLLWIIVGFALVSGVFQYVNAGAPGAGAGQQTIGQVSEALLRMGGLA